LFSFIEGILSFAGLSGDTTPNENNTIAATNNNQTEQSPVAGNAMRSVAFSDYELLESGIKLQWEAQEGWTCEIRLLEGY
jgi:hypothetical protein